MNNTPYVCARDLYRGGTNNIFLDANENAFGSAINIPMNIALNRYPDPRSEKLKKSLGGFLKVPGNSIFIGAGSDQIIDLLARIFIKPGNEAIIFQPTFDMYRVAVETAEGKPIPCPLNDEFQMDLKKIKQMLNKKTKIVFCCSPNSPTGNLLKSTDIEKLCKIFRGIVVVDEAYIEFSSGESFSRRIKSLRNLVVLRTFSKAWGLANIRVGYAIASPAIIDRLNRIKMPYAVNGISEYIAIQALRRKKRMIELCDQIKNEREKLFQKLRTMGLRVFPSEANFLLVKTRNARLVCGEMANKYGIIVRDFSSKPELRNCIRVTVGTPKENEKFISALTKLIWK